MIQENANRNAQHAELRLLSEHWGKGLLSTDEALGCLLAYLAGQNQEPRTKNREPETATLPAQVLGTLLRQLGDAVDALAGPQLDLWRAGDLWYWRWQDTSSLASHGLGSLGEALTDAIEHRHPDAFPEPRGET